MDLFWISILLVTGLFGGFISGLIGIGGGTIYILILPYVLEVLGVPEEHLSSLTIANSLAAIFLSALSASVSNLKMVKAHIKEIALIGLSSILVSVLLTEFWVNTDLYKWNYFNGVIILVLAITMIFTLSEKDKESENRIDPNWRHLVIIGALSGFIAAISGLGGGIVIIPLLHIWKQYSFQRASAISLAVIALGTFFTTLYNLSEASPILLNTPVTGRILWVPVALLSFGVLLTAPLGVKSAKLLSGQFLRNAYAVLLLLIIVEKISRLI
jgi:uncharacterized membrane protein YfcA